VNSRAQADYALGVTIAYFSSKGHTVFLPITDAHGCDLVVDIDGELKRVEIRSTSQMSKSGYYVASINTVKHVSCRKFDLLLIASKDGSIWIFPKENIIDINSHITLNHERDMYKVCAGMMELADIPDLKSGSLNESAGSSPATGTTTIIDKINKRINNNEGKFRCYHCGVYKSIDQFRRKRKVDEDSVNRKDYNSACLDCMGDVIKDKLRVLK
jgi:hypothetical protein